jgi:hypothetical protein
VARVLSIGYLQDFLRKRNLHIRNGGHKVTPARSVQAAIDLAEQDAFDVLVFGHGVPTADRNFIAGHFKSAYPRVAIIFLYESRIEKAELADAILNVHGDPGDLVQTIEYLSQRKPPEGKSFRNTACLMAVVLPSIGGILSKIM